MNKGSKVLFVVMDFWQAGAERFAFEIDSALNRDRFDITFLSVRDLNSSTDFADHYYSMHKALGSKIVFLSEIVGTPDISTRIKGRLLRSLNKDINNHKQLTAFLQQFDVVNWIGEYTFSMMVDKIDEAVFTKSIIHIMTAKFQANYYSNFPKNRHYLFVSGFDTEQQITSEFSDFPHYHHVVFPLYFNVNTTSTWHFNKGSQKKKIGIFTRLSPMKPLDPFIYAFHLLRDALPEAELHLFGSGDPVAAGIQKYVDHLGLNDHVFFRGHQENIVETALKEHLDLVWFQGYNNRPAGYAGYDISSVGIPQLFWEFTKTTANNTAADAIYPVYKNINRFVQHSQELLTDEQKANSLSARQMADIAENMDMKRKIHILEDLFVKVAAEAKNVKPVS